MRKHIFDKENAIKFMKENARYIVPTEVAVALLKPFTPFAIVKKTEAGKIGMELPEFALDIEKRITWFGKEREGVSIYDISAKIVEILGEEPHYDSPYFGTGRTAEHITMNNLAKICAKLGMETDECKCIFAWIFPKDFENLKRLNPKISEKEYEKLRKMV